MSRLALPQNYDKRQDITLVDWVSTGQTPANCVAVIAGSQIALVPVGEEPEGYVPGGGRCIKLTKTGDTDRIMFDLALPAPVALDGDASYTVNCPMYYPSSFNSQEEGASCGVGIYICSGGYVSNRYSKDHYPSVGQPRTGWNSFCFQMEGVGGGLSMGKTGSPNLKAINYIRFSLENTGATAPGTRYAYIGPITFGRTARTKVIFSFDDGMDSIYTNANGFTLMKAYGFPGTLGLYDNIIDAGGRLSMAQIAEMQAAGWEVACHSDAHINYRVVSDEEAIADIYRGTMDMRNRGLSFRHFIWPGGAYREASKAYVRSLGYDGAWSIGNDFIRTPFGANLSGDYGTFPRFAAENTGGTVNAITYVDWAIKHGFSIGLYLHSIISGASGANTTNETEFATMLAALKRRQDLGLIDVVTMSEWYAGLSGARIDLQTGRVGG